MPFISSRAALPILTALTESALADANGLATMSRGALFTVWVRELRGMPCAANGATETTPTIATRARRSRYILDLQQDGLMGQESPRFLCGYLWAKRDSNPRHPACKAGALNQLSYSPGSGAPHFFSSENAGTVP